MKLQAASPADQVEDQHDYSNNDQNVDQTAADMEREAQEPQNHKNYEDCPEHGASLSGAGAKKP
jgi:hypothetical protein